MQTKKSSEVHIAVLPFENASNDRDLDYFVEGLYDDFIMDLSRFRALQIISQKSVAKAVKGTDASKGIEGLDADFIIKGKVRRTGSTVRIYIQLESASKNLIVWTERFEADTDKLFDMQEQMLQRLSNSIQQQIDMDLLAGARKKQPRNLESYDYWLRGYEQLKKVTLESDLKAREYFEEALKKDAYFSRAYTGLSLSYFNEWSCQLWDLWDSSMDNALKYAKKAIELDPNDAISLTVAGRIHLYRGDYEKGEYYLKKSLELNRNEASNLAQIAVSYVYLGKLQKALEYHLKARELDPLNQDSYEAAATLIYFELGEFEKAIASGLKADMDNSWIDLAYMIAGAYYMTGEVEKMKEYWNLYLRNFSERMMKGKKVEPREALDWIVKISPYGKNSRYIPFLEYLSRNLQTPSETASIKERPQNKANRFVKGTGLWEMSFEGRTAYLPEKKGYHDLRKLLENPGEKLACLDLMGSSFQRERKLQVMDDKARADYKKRILDLQQEIKEFDERNDFENLKKCQEEYDYLLDFLSKSLQKSGKTRKFNDAADKARSAVTWRIRDAIKRIGDAHPALGRHFKHSIITGHACTYAPESDTEWQLT